MPTPSPGGNGMCDGTSASYPVTLHPTTPDLTCLEAYLPRRARLARIPEKGTTRLNVLRGGPSPERQIRMRMLTYCHRGQRDTGDLLYYKAWTLHINHNHVYLRIAIAGLAKVTYVPSNAGSTAPLMPPG